MTVVQPYFESIFESGLEEQTLLCEEYERIDRFATQAMAQAIYNGSVSLDSIASATTIESLIYNQEFPEDLHAFCENTGEAIVLMSLVIDDMSNAGFTAIKKVGYDEIEHVSGGYYDIELGDDIDDFAKQVEQDLMYFLSDIDVPISYVVATQDYWWTRD